MQEITNLPRIWQKIIEWPLLVFLTSFSSTLPLKVNDPCSTSLGYHFKLPFPLGFLSICHSPTYLKLYSLTILNFSHFPSANPFPLIFRQFSLLVMLLPASQAPSSNCLGNSYSLFMSQFRHNFLQKCSLTLFKPTWLPCTPDCTPFFLYTLPKENTHIRVTWELIKSQIHGYTL